MSYKKPSRETCAHCHFCGVPFPQIPETRYIRGRLVVFCGYPRNCFKKYIAANPKAADIPLSKPEEVARRAKEHLQDYKLQVLFLPESSHVRLFMEGVIFELTEIVEGRQRVTIQERSAPQM